jgi:N-acylneuraminate cytidylyltransferase
VLKQKSIAVIPARGGSKRIPKKNIIDFSGKPLIVWTIEAAINSKIFDRVIVSTDCEEIAAISKDFGAEVPFLRQEYADDNSTVSESVLFTLNQAENFYNEKYDIVAQLMPNCPLRGKSEIINAYNFFVNNNFESQISCFSFGWMNPWWANKLDNNKPIPVFEEALNKRSQDLEELYCPSGAVWFANSEILKEKKSFYTGNHSFYPMDRKKAIDIDNYDDLEMAKALLTI